MKENFSIINFLFDTEKVSIVGSKFQIGTKPEFLIFFLVFSAGRKSASSPTDSGSEKDTKTRQIPGRKPNLFVCSQDRRGRIYEAAIFMCGSQRSITEGFSKRNEFFIVPSE